MGSPPKILYVISHFEMGGAEKYVHELCISIGKRMHISVSAVFGGLDSEFARRTWQQSTLSHVALHCGITVPFRLGGLLIAAIRLRKLIREINPDIVHLHTEIPELTFALCSLIDRSLRRMPIVRTIHNTVIWPKWGSIGAWSERMLADSSVIYVSDAVRTNYHAWRRACKILRAPNLEKKILNPVSVLEFRQSLANARLSNGKIRLMFAGRFESQKGFDLLPEIIENVVLPRGVRPVLYLFGEGSGLPAMKAFRNSAPVDWKIRLYPPHSEIVSIMPLVDILLFPSRFEGFGRLAAEAVLVGIPVVAFQLPVLYEVFPGDYPWLVPFSDQDTGPFSETLSSLMSTLVESQSVVNNAQALLAGSLNPDRIAIKHLEFYRAVMTSSTS